MIETLSMASNEGKFIIWYERPDYRHTQTLVLRRESDGWTIAEYGRETET